MLLLLATSSENSSFPNVHIQQSEKQGIHAPLEEQSTMDTHKSWCTPMHRGRKSKHWEEQESSHCWERRKWFSLSLITSYIPLHRLQPQILCVSRNISEIYTLPIKWNQGWMPEKAGFSGGCLGSAQRVIINHKSSLGLCRTDRQGSLKFPSAAAAAFAWLFCLVSDCPVHWIFLRGKRSMEGWGMSRVCILF